MGNFMRIKWVNELKAIFSFAKRGNWLRSVVLIIFTFSKFFQAASTGRKGMNPHWKWLQGMVWLASSVSVTFTTLSHSTRVAPLLPAVLYLVWKNINHLNVTFFLPNSVLTAFYALTDLMFTWSPFFRWENQDIKKFNNFSHVLAACKLKMQNWERGNLAQLSMFLTTKLFYLKNKSFCCLKTKR